MIDVTSSIIKAVYSYTQLIITAIYNIIMQVVNDPVVQYVTRALIAEPIIALGKFIGTVYLGVYSFVTNDAIKYYFFSTYVLPVVYHVYWFYRGI